MLTSLPHILTLFAYILGIVGVIIDVSEYLIHDHKLFKKVAILNAGIWALQYACLQAYTAAATLVVAMARTHYSEKCKTEKSKWILLLISAIIFLSLSLMTWSGWISLIPVIALIITTHAMTFKDNIGMRKELLGAIALWFINDFYWQAYTAIFSNTITFIFNSLVIYKLLKLKPEDEIHGLTKEI